MLNIFKKKVSKEEAHKAKVRAMKLQLHIDSKKARTQ